MRASRGLKWENKTYKLKRSISPVAQAAKIVLRPRNSVGGQSLNRDCENKANPYHLDNIGLKLEKRVLRLFWASSTYLL